MSSAESNPRVVGIDVSQQWLDIHLLPNGDEGRFSNDDAGFRKLARKLKPHLPRVIVLEGSGGLERGVATYLAQASLPVAIVNPRQVRDFAKASGRLAKTDAIDAQIIARFGEAVNIQPRFIPDVPRQELRALVSRREQLVGMLKAEKVRLQRAYDPSVRDSHHHLISVIQAELNGVDGQIDVLIQNSPIWRANEQLLREIKGVGPQLSRMVIAALPELGRLNRREIASLVGVAPFNDDSGKRTGKRKIRGGRPHVRRVLYMAAVAAMRCNPQIKVYHDRLKENGKKNKVIIVACMRKLLITMNAVMKSEIVSVANAAA
jgi:transposase